MTSAPPRPDELAPTNRPDPAPPARPSSAQVLASVLTATTTTFALSYLGVAGTIIGAGLASTFTVLANYWYTRTIMHTQRKVTQFTPRTTRLREAPRTNVAGQVPTPVDSELAVTVATSHNSSAASTTVEAAAFETAVGEQTVLFDLPAGATESPAAPSAPAPTAPSPNVSQPPPAKDGESLMAPARSGRRRFILPIIVLFVLLLGVVTAIEYGLGKPLSDALRGKEGSGTSLSHIRTPGQAKSSTPEVEPTDAPGSGETNAPSEKPTSEPNEPGPAEPSPDVDPTEPPAPGAGEPEQPVEPEAPAENPQPGDNAAGVDKPDPSPTDTPSPPAGQPQGEQTADPTRLIVSASRAAGAE